MSSPSVTVTTRIVESFTDGSIVAQAASIWSADAIPSDAEKARLRDLDDRCLQARTERLKVVQEQKIQTCIEVDKQDPDYCRRFFKDYGWGSVTASGTRNPRLFDEIPECIAAFNARKDRDR